MSSKRKIKWLIAHHPQYLFIRTAKFFVKELEKILPGQFEIEILTMNDYIEKYGDIEELKLRPPKIDGLEDGELTSGLTRVEKVSDTRQKWTAIFQAIVDGKIELSQTQVTTIGAILSRDFVALDMPYLFKDHAHATAVLDGPIGQEILDSLSNQTEVKGLAFTYSGGYRVIGSKQPINSLDELKNLSLLTTTLPSHELFQTLGTHSISSKDAGANDYADIAANNGCVETTYLRFSGNHIFKTNHSMFLTSILTGNAFWNTLNEEQKLSFKLAAKRCAVIERQWSVKDAEVYERYSTLNNISIKSATAEETQALKQCAEDVYQKISFSFTPGLIDKIKAAGE